MSEESEMNADPLAEKLGRFTPDSSGLDRDAFLVRLGQASARPRRFWPLATAMLALTQVVTLFLLLTRSPEPIGPASTVAPSIVPITPPSGTLPYFSPFEPALQSYWKAGLSGNLDDLPSETIIDDMPAPSRVLTAHSIGSVLALEN